MDILKRFKFWLWGIQKPTNGYVRESDRIDKVWSRFIMLIVFGLFGMVIVGLILLG